MGRMLRRLVGFMVFVSVVAGSPGLAGLLRASAGGGPTTIYVDATATGAGNGTSWADAYVSLQVALSGAVSGSQIWVAEGTYRPGIERSSTFQLKNGVELYGGFPQGGGGGTMDARDPWRYTTILSGEIGDPGVQTDNCYHVLTAVSTDATAVLDGFQVTAGHANEVSYSTGGGMLNADGSPVVRNTVFLRNYAADFGGAIENTAGSPTLENVVFYGNQAGRGGGAVDNFNNGYPDISNGLFVGNTAQSGGAVHSESSSTPVLRNVTMVANEAATAGGAIFTDDTSGAAVMNSILWGNSPDQIYISAGGTASVYYTILQGGCPADVTCEGVIADDPLFVTSPSPGIASQAEPSPPSWGDDDDLYGDLRLETGSPAIDSGNNAMLKPGVVTDLMGNPRLTDGPGGGGFTVDRGAYEAPPTPIYVDQSAAGANSGYSWANALQDLQDAFIWGRSGVTEIWVAEGTYLPGDLRTSTFQLLDRMAVYGAFPAGGGDGTFGARDWHSYRTHLSGDIGVPLERTDNVYHVVTASDVGAPILDSVFVEYGHADGDGYSQGLGGGIYAPNAHPRLHRVVVLGCYAETGGGGAYFQDSEAKLSETEFYLNASGREGGGLLLVNGSQFVIQDSYFRVNAATGPGGGLCSAGGHLTLYDTYFESNQAARGGGLYLGDVSARLHRARFLINTADGDGAGLLAEMQSDLTVTDSLFSNNSAAGGGGGLAVNDTELTLRNVTLSGNYAGGNGGAADVGFTTAVFHNTILWGNAAAGSGDQVHLGDPGDLSLNHSLVEDGCPVGALCNDTVTDDPLFYADPDPGDDGIWGTFDDELGDLRLWKISPAIDAGDTNAVGINRLDLARNPRLVDVASVADTGEGPSTVPVVDIGAYESPPDVVHVDQAAAGAYSGLTWTDAFTDVQDALAWGSSGPADVWIAQGTYTPGFERDDSFHLVKGVSLYGGFPTGGDDGTFGVRDWRAYTTTLSGEIGAPNDRGDNS
ncbi:MAG: choice-of-anchor Q domain-containing protein, partial [Chloroflexota bacterium]